MIVLTGANGMLGRELARALRRDDIVEALAGAELREFADRAALDITDAHAVAEVGNHRRREQLVEGSAEPLFHCWILSRFRAPTTQKIRSVSIFASS